MDALEIEANTFEDIVDIGVISVACTLGYLELRFPDESWRDTRPNLSTWYDRFCRRPSMIETKPPADLS